MKTSIKSIIAICAVMVFANLSIAQSKNISKGKFVDVSTAHAQWPSSNATDGVTDKHGNATISTAVNGSSWLQIDLGKYYDIDRVNFYPYGIGIPAKTNSVGIFIAVSDDPTFGGCLTQHCFHYQNGYISAIPSSGNPMVKRLQNVTGRYVRFYCENKNPIGIWVSEVEVFGKVSDVNEKIATQEALASGDNSKIKSLVVSGDLDMSTSDLQKLCIDKKDTEILSAALSKNKTVNASTMDYALSNYNKAVVKTFITNGDVDLNKTITTAVITNNDMPSLKSIINKDRSAASEQHIIQAMNSGNTEMAEYLISSGVKAGSKTMDLAITSGNESMVRTVMEDTSPTTQNLNSAIISKQTGIIDLMKDKARPNSETFVLVAQQNDSDLYEELTLENRIPNNKSIEIAIDNNNKAILSAGLNEGGDANKALDYAILKKNKMAIDKILTKKSVDVNKAIPYAVTSNDTELLSTILNEKDGDANKALDAAVLNDKESMMIVALETDRTSSDKHLKTVIDKGHDNVAKLMVEKGASADKGMLPAIEKENKSMVEFLLENGADPSNNSYMESAASRDLGITETLLNMGADADAGMVTAASNNKSSIVDLLVTSGANPDLGLKPALKNNHTESAKILIENGATPTGVIGIPARFGNDEIVTLLLDSGADPQNGMSDACSAGQVSVVDKLLEYGAVGGDSKYMVLAVAGLHAGLIPILFEQGSDPDKRYSDGSTFIIAAAKNPNCLNTVTALIQGGVSITEVDNQGNTALHIAVKQGKENAPVINALVNGGIDVNALNNKGETPLKVAKNSKTKKTLKKLGGVKKVK